MNCTMFRRRFHGMLDFNEPRDFAGEMAEHFASCPSCVSHVKRMEAVDAALRNAPEIELPETLLKKLATIPDSCAREDARRATRHRIFAAGCAFLPAVLMAILALRFAPDCRAILLTVVAILACLFMAMLKEFRMA